MLNKLLSITTIFTILLIFYITTIGFTTKRANVKLTVCNNLNKTMYYNIERLDHQIIEYKGEWFPVAGGELDVNTCNHNFPGYHARIYKIDWYNGYKITRVIMVSNECIKIIFYPDHTEFVYREDK